MLKQLFISMRPKQWSKNMFVLAAVVFTGNFTNLLLVARAVAAFFIFCCLSGSVYLINDVKDKEVDSVHPKKRNRPIASGALSARAALGTSLVLGGAGIGVSFLLSFPFGLCAIAYVALMIGYSLFLKDIIIIDAFAVSLGFVLRLLAGGLAIFIVSTPWSLMMTFFLAIFISLVKRKAEKEMLGEKASSHRKNLYYYRKETLDYLVIISATTVIISYALFTLFSGKSSYLYITIPFVLYGVFRYMYLAFERTMGDSPSVLFIKDKPLFYTVMSWVLFSAVIIYFA